MSGSEPGPGGATCGHPAKPAAISTRPISAAGGRSATACARPNARVRNDHRKPAEEQAAAEPIDATWKPLPQNTPDEIGLLPTLARLAREFPGQITATSIDSLIQRQATAAVEDQLKILSSSNVSAAAVVVVLDTPTGQCLAAVSRAMDRPNDAVDLDLTIRRRSSGSTLKPFILRGRL